MKFSTEGLASAGMDLVAPFRVEVRLDPGAGETGRLEAAQPGVLEFKSITRVMPNRRVSGEAEFVSDMDMPGRVFAKIVYGKNARRYWLRELGGAEKLGRSSAPTASVLGRGTTADDQGYVVFYELIQDARTLDEFQMSEIEQAVVCLAELHQANLLQTDVHLGNFLINNNAVYVVDADGVMGGVTLRQHFANLAMFFAQRAPECDLQIAALWAVYAGVRGDYVQAMGSAQLLHKLTQRARRQRLRRYLKKTQRECTEFVHKHSFSHDFVCDRQHWHTLQRFRVFPDAIMGEGVPLKLGNSSTVVRCELDGESYIIKRYNIKGIAHRLRRWFKHRARNAWKNGHTLAFLRVPTARPVALLEQRWGWFRGVAYLVMPNCGERDMLHALVADGVTFESVAPQTIRILQKMQAAGLQHGDFKATNFLLSKAGIGTAANTQNEFTTDVCLVDYDALRSGPLAPDLARFMANWRDHPELHAAWAEALQNAGLEWSQV